MRTVIIEDEKPILELMKIIIGKNEHLEIVGTFTDSKEALDNILKLSPEVVFMDIEMPHISGMVLAKEIMKFNENIQIVFVTAYEKYAIDAFKVNAVNYILKPITEEDINITVNRLLRNYNLRKDISENKKKNKIFAFGCLKIYGSLNNDIIKWTTSKVQELFAYFVYAKGSEIDKWKLCDILWPDSSPKKAEHNLHSTIYRLKTALKKIGIEDIVYYEKGRYSMALNSFYCDLWEYENFIENNPVVNKENIGDYEKTLELYEGIIFGNENYIWAIELNEKLDKYYLDSGKNIAKYYIERKLYNKAEEYLKKVMKKDPYDEEAHELIMLVHFYAGDKIGLFNHYMGLNKLLIEELDIEPKESTNKLYKTLIAKL